MLDQKRNIILQIEGDRSVCPACGAGLEFVPLLHHMICAYVGPQYDFAPAGAGYSCPKCRRHIGPGDPACEIVGTSARCVRCDKETVVSPTRSVDILIKPKLT
jgi:hypothetical protein